MSVSADDAAGATVARRAASSQPRERDSTRESVLHIRKTIIIMANMRASPAIHIVAPPACRSAVAVPAQTGRAPAGRPGVPRLAYPSTRPVNVSTGMMRKSTQGLAGDERRPLVGAGARSGREDMGP